MSDHDALAVVRYGFVPGVALEHRGARLLDLEEQGIVGGCQKKHDIAACPDAADAHDLQRDVDHFEPVEQTCDAPPPEFRDTA